MASMSPSQIRTQLTRYWEAACMDNPVRPSCRVVDGEFVFTIKGNQDGWDTLTKLAGVPHTATQEIVGESLICRWKSHADEIFGADGLIAQKLGEKYEVRMPQLHMARLVQRSIEMSIPAVVEAGTGVGKSFAYAAVCMAMGKRVVISTSNKALQMQLAKKDLPFLCEIFPGKRVALAVGKSNYVCRHKVEDPVSGGTKIKGDLLDWYDSTETGNTEEIPFAVDWKELAGITVDDDCGGKNCPLYSRCFYYDAKTARQGADVIVTNHALLALSHLYPAANLLPETEVVVVDEAHKLADFVRNTIGVEFSASNINRTISLAEPFVDSLDTYLEAQRQAAAFLQEIGDWLSGKVDVRTGKLDPQIGIAQGQVFTSGQTLADTLEELAEEVFAPFELPSDSEERKRARRATRIMNLADKLRVITAHHDGMVRWIEPNDIVSFRSVPSNVSRFIGSLAGVMYSESADTVAAKQPDHTKCTRCGRTLTAEKVAILEGHPFGPECIQKVDVFGDAETVLLADWLAQEHPAPAQTKETEVTFGRPVIFTSATLAAPRLDHFMRECGLPDALQMQANSPFDYANNALLYAPNGSSPAPNERGWSDWMCDQLAQLVRASKGGAFLLFTSYANMNYAVAQLSRSLRGYTFLVQGELPKLELARRFREDGNAVLFATKSFFEGVSIDGDALRLVVVDKLPFEAPSPLSTAMEADALAYARDVIGLSGRRLEMYPFDALRVPRMIIDLKQAAGRLIRTTTDTGVIAVLDSRLRGKQYGREAVIPALPPAPRVSHIEMVTEWFRQHRAAPEPTDADMTLAKVLNGGRKPSRDAALYVEKKVNYEDNGDALWA